MLRRVLELAHVHLPGSQVAWDLPPWLEPAARGLVGTLTVEGDLAAPSEPSCEPPKSSA